MNFPLFVPTYELNGRIYRRNVRDLSRNVSEYESAYDDSANLYSGDVDVSDNEYLSEGSVDSQSDDVLTASTVDSMDDEKDKCTVGSSIDFDPKSQKWSMSMKVPSPVRRFIIGPKGSMKRKLEEETDCKLVFPHRAASKQPIKIISMISEESVARCRDRVELLLISARDRAAFTHFVSLPITHSVIQENFKLFIDAVKNDNELPESCKTSSLFQEPSKLHLTLTMLTLLSEDEQKAVAKSLKDVIDEKIRDVLDGEPLNVKVEGLEIMNDDPSRVRILYARTHSERLDNIANLIASAMSDTGYAQVCEGPVKLHLTLMNTKYAWQKERKKEKMDTEKLLEKYKDYFFGNIVIPEVHISSLVDPKDESGYYKSVANFSLAA